MEGKEKLFEVALDEFTKQGYDRASLNNILKKAGISKGSFYYHFRNKQELYLHIFKRLHDLQHEYIDKWKRENKLDYRGMNFFDILKLEGRIALEMVTKYPKCYEFWKSIYQEKSDEAREVIDKEIKRLIKEGHVEDHLTPLIDEGLKNKDFREELTEKFIKGVLKNFMISFSTCFIREDEGVKMENLLEDYYEYIDFLRRGLGNR